MPAPCAPPPAATAIPALADRCVQCGLCLPHCPTYRLDGNEAESPRGRIALSRALADGTLAVTERSLRHLDHCLGCRRCELACPAGVEYGRLLLASRALSRAECPPSARLRSIEALSARPERLDRLLGLYRRLFRLLPTRWRVLPRPPPIAKHPLPDSTGASIAVFGGCVGGRYEAPVRAALSHLCARLGVALDTAPRRTCCGALHAHAGDPSRAEALAAENRAAFASFERVLTTASGCHDTLARALAGVVRVEDALVFLAERREHLRFAPAHGRVALHLPCTQRGQPESVAALRDLLAAVPGLDAIELPDTGCCGAAGSHMLAFPERARRLRQPLLDDLRRSGANTLLSGNLGCRLHLDAGTGIVVIHPLEFLAEHLQ